MRTTPRCGHCGAETVTVWVAPDDLWLAFNGASDGIACTDCFVRWAVNDGGFVPRFRVEVVGG